MAAVSRKKFKFDLEDCFKIYISIRSLPNTYHIEEKIDGNKRVSKTTRIQHPLWQGDKNLLKNCINPHLMFRVCGKIEDLVRLVK